jgi:large subunit ribosomal protein L15
MNILSQLKPSPGSVKKRKRIGRGTGSGLGKTSGKGNKGQKSRSGPKIAPSFEGGQMPLNRRLPKRGFTNTFKKQIATLNLDDLDRMAHEQSEVNVQIWVAEGRIKKAKDGVKILGRGELSRALTVRAHLFSHTAKEKILAAGGQVEEII